MNSVPTSKALRFQYTHYNKLDYTTDVMWFKHQIMKDGNTNLK